MSHLMRRYFWGLFLCGFCVMGCSEPAKEILGTTSDGKFEVTLRADPNWVRPSSTLLVELVVRRLDPLAQLGFGDNISLVANNGTITPSTITPSFAPAVGDSIEKQVFQTFLQFRAPTPSFNSAGGEQESEIQAIFRDVKTTFKVRVVPLGG